MLTYIPSTNWRRKDFLPQGDPDKIITSAELHVEFVAVQRSINSAGGSYTITTNFLPKDSLARGEPEKIVDGYEIAAEFAAIETAIAGLGGSYTHTWDFEELHDTDEEILGLHFHTEFYAIADAIETIRNALPGQGIITEAAEFFFITTEDDDQLVTE